MAAYGSASGEKMRLAEDGRKLQDQIARFQGQLESGELTEGTQQHTKATKMVEFLERDIGINKELYEKAEAAYN